MTKLNTITSDLEVNKWVRSFACLKTHGITPEYLVKKIMAELNEKIPGPSR
jgi:hypothetical protein